ncbi:methionine adenosyltransferase, partial [archaeon]|nr:methionine adenosyltransferase [archaeon]
MKNYLFTSESVTEGHPDKICDHISDAILDECLRQDPQSRVGVETCSKTGMVLVMGEITTHANLDIPKIVRQSLKEIGYTKSSHGIEYETCAVLVHLEEQSPEISQGVTEGKGKFQEQGAGDQGMMFGYACNETKELMPLPIQLAHKLTKRLALVRKIGEIPYLGPDGKSQVTIDYEDDKPKRIETVVVSNQHAEQINHETIRKDILEKVINPICKDLMDEQTKIYINPTGSFVRGGPYADAGLTGRKIIVDTYGGVGRHGGGAFSGK